MSIFNWVIPLTPADTGLALEVQAVNQGGFPSGDPATNVVEVGNGFYIWSTLAPPADGFLIARLLGGGPPLAMRGISASDVLAVQPDGTVLVGDVGNVNGQINGDLLGRVVGYSDPVNDPNFGTGLAFWGPGVGDVAGRALGDTSSYPANDLPIPPIVGPGVHLDPDDPAYPTGGGGDPETIATTVWAYLLSLPITPGSVLELLVLKLMALGGASVTVQSSMSTDGGTIHVVIGDSYEVNTAHRNAAAWTDTTDQLTGLTIAGMVWETNTGLLITLTPDTVGGHVHAALELGRSDTGTWTHEQKVKWAVTITLSDGDVITWKQGLLVPRARV